MVALLLWVTLGTGSQPFTLQDRFDMIELNHMHDEVGRPTFVQLIFWDWSSHRKSFVCQGYFMLDGSIVKTDEGKKEKNIKRRVYDALNVQLAAGVLQKRGKDIMPNQNSALF